MHHWLPPRSSRTSVVPAADAFEVAELEAAQCSSWYSSSSSQHPARLARLSLAGCQFLTRIFLGLRYRHTLSDLLHANIQTSLHVLVPFSYVLLAALFLSVSLVVWRFFRDNLSIHPHLIVVPADLCLIFLISSQAFSPPMTYNVPITVILNLKPMVS